MNTVSVPLPAASSARRDFATIGLIGLAHGCSHFFHMLLPPLFPAFIRDFGLSYSELGLLVSTFFVISGMGQALAGFLVDRTGARPVLFAALSCFVLSAVAAATANGFGGLLLAAALAGLGNSPFHPVDFTILNKRVSQPRLGHAFSVHGISGNLGWAVAPVFSIGIAEATGSWRFACGGFALVALAILLLLALNRQAIDDRQGSWAHERAGSGSAPAPKGEHPMAFLRLPSVWLCFSFFFFSTAALSAMQSFASPALQKMFALPGAVTALVVTGYMLCGAAGMVVGGFLVARSGALERNIGFAMAASAVLLLIAGTGWLPGMVTAVIAAVAGFGTGLAGPSRDMLIKRASPPGATGRVYGTVYSGLDVGFALAPLMFGVLMDHGWYAATLAGGAVVLALSAYAALGVGKRVAVA